MLHAQDLLANIGEVSRRFAGERPARQHRRELDPIDIASLKEIGLHLATVPEQYGGWWQGRQKSVRTQCEALRLLAEGDPSVALVASMHPSVLCFWRDPDPPETGVAAWEAQKREVFGTVVDGAWWGTITSEPGSAGDIARTSARALPANENPDRFVLSGEKHFGSGSGATTHVVTTARRSPADEPEWFFLDVRGAAWDGSGRMTLKAAWDGHGMASTSSHAFQFTDYPATRMAWPGPWRDVMLGTGGAGAIANVAVFVGIVDAAMKHARQDLIRRGQQPDSLRPYERVEWTEAHREAWLVHQAFEGAVSAIERKGRARHEVSVAAANIAVLAESVLTRLCRIAGGSSYGRRSPLGFWFEDVRALGFLRPPWALASDALFSLSLQDEAA